MGDFPNKLQQWEKGKSGNPNGRPKGSKNRATIVRKWLDAFVKGLDLQGNEVDMTAEDKITLEQIKKAFTGDTTAYNALMNSGYGQPKQEITNEQKTELIIQPVNEEVRKAIEDN